MLYMQVAKQFGWDDVCQALIANERRRVKLSGGETRRFSADFPAWEPEPFGPKRMSVTATWGRDSKHGTWGTPPNPLTPKFVPRDTKLS